MKKLLKIFGALFTLLLVAALAIPMFISADFIKAQLVAQVKKATGRELVIKGEASLRIFPNIAVSVADVTLGNPAGFSDNYFVHIDTLKTGAALKPLLNKELRITGISVEGMKLNLEETASGAKNWDFAQASAPAQPAEKNEANAEKKSPLKQFVIGDVTLKDSAIHYAKAGAKAVAVTAMNLTIEGADGSSPLKIDGRASYQGEDVSVQLDLAKSKAFLAGKESPVTLALKLPAAAIGFKGVASNSNGMRAEGALDAAIENLPKLIGWATGKPASAGLPKKLALKTGLFMQNEKAFALKDMTFEADALSMTGSLALNLAGAVPDVKGNLNMTELDLDALTSTPTTGAKANAAAVAAPASKGDGWSNAPIDASALRAVNANLKLAIGTLKSGKIVVSKIAADTSLISGVMKVNLANASLYNGTAKGTVSLDGSGAGVGIGTNLTLANIQVEPLMVAMSGASRVEGTAALGLAITGRGTSQRAIVSSLGGNGNFKINDGAIKGINVASFLRDAKKGFILGDSTHESTDFTELTASYTIAQGVVSNSDLAMKSPILRLAGKGTVSLPPRTINYRLTPTIVGTLKGQGGKDKLSSGGLEIPLIVTGPWSAISVTPDFAGMLQEGLKNPAALKQNIKDIGDTISKFNSPKDIGKALFGGGPTEAAPAAAPATTAPATDQPAAAPAPAPKQPKLEDAIGGLLNTLAK